MAEQALETEEKPEADARSEDTAGADGLAESAEKQSPGDVAESSESDDSGKSEKEKKPVPPVPAPSSGGISFITVRDRYIIYYDRPVPNLDMPNALAFEVEDRKQPGRGLYALVCKPEMMPRISVMRTLKGNELINTLHMVDWGAAEWPPASRKCVIIIYYRPMGGRVMASLSSVMERIPDHQFPKMVIRPIAEALTELGLKGITHRALRPDNLYYMDEQRTKIVVGDCSSSVPAYDQPVIFETIESGMCNPAGRGSGMYVDDMYSFGVTLLVLALGRNPLAGKSDDFIIDKKSRKAHTQL